MSERTSPPIETPERDPAASADIYTDARAPADRAPGEAGAPPKGSRRRGLAALLLVPAIGAAVAWGGYRVVFPPRSGGPSEVRISHLGASRTHDDAGDDGSASSPPEHPLDPALEIARKGLAHIRADVDDYTARMVKRERILGQLTEEETVFLKVRNRKVKGGKLVTPLSVYMRFLEPEAKKGREVIWVENQNDGDLIAHDAGLARFIRAKLPTDSFLAMLGNRYPINDVGIENLVAKLIERGEREKKVGQCEVAFKNAELNGRACTLIEICHPKPDPKFEFYLARIYIDKELFVPIRYAAYRWPEEEGGKMLLEEEYTYLDLKLNVGLTDEDFDPDNPEYAFP